MKCAHLFLSISFISIPFPCMHTLALDIQCLSVQLSVPLQHPQIPGIKWQEQQKNEQLDDCDPHTTFYTSSTHIVLRSCPNRTKVEILNRISVSLSLIFPISNKANQFKCRYRDCGGVVVK